MQSGLDAATRRPGDVDDAHGRSARCPDRGATRGHSRAWSDGGRAAPACATFQSQATPRSSAYRVSSHIGVRVAGWLAVRPAAVPIRVGYCEEGVKLTLELPVECDGGGVLTGGIGHGTRRAFIWPVRLEHGHTGALEEGDNVIAVPLMERGAKVGDGASTHGDRASACIGGVAGVVACQVWRVLHQGVSAHLDPQGLGVRGVGRHAGYVRLVGRGRVEARAEREEHRLEANRRGLCGHPAYARGGRVGRVKVQEALGHLREERAHHTAPREPLALGLSRVADREGRAAATGRAGTAAAGAGHCARGRHGVTGRARRPRSPGRSTTLDSSYGRPRTGRPPGPRQGRRQHTPKMSCEAYSQSPRGGAPWRPRPRVAPPSPGSPPAPARRRRYAPPPTYS
eukprot:scaffold99866_cov57-Phaeocystis_antarctica.AAC.1